MCRVQQECLVPEVIFKFLFIDFRWEEGRRERHTHTARQTDIDLFFHLCTDC